MCLLKSIAMPLETTQSGDYADVSTKVIYLFNNVYKQLIVSFILKEYFYFFPLQRWLNIENGLIGVYAIKIVVLDVTKDTGNVLLQEAVLELHWTNEIVMFTPAQVHSYPLYKRNN